MSEQEFLSELKELLKKHPEVAKTFLVHGEETTEQPAVERSGNKRCIRWGVIPGTNERVCLEWGDVESDDRSRARVSGAPRAASRARPRTARRDTR
jgi:hypothetical protein